MRKISLCLCVRGFLKNAKFPSHYRQMFKEGGRTLSPEEARDFLMDELAKGHEKIPCEARCGNPCQETGCEGFDYGEHGGCPGSVVPDDD